MSAARVVSVNTRPATGARIESEFLPQRVAMVGQGNAALPYSVDPVRISSASQAAELYGVGSPLYRMAQLLTPSNMGGRGNVELTAYPVQADPGGTTAQGSIGVLSGTALLEDATYRLTVGGVFTQYDMPEGSTALQLAFVISAGVNQLPNYPVESNLVGGPNPEAVFSCRWKGESGSFIPIKLEIISGGAGIQYFQNAMAGGGANPSVTPALDKIRDRWETVIVSGFNYSDQTLLDGYQDFGEARWAADVARPVVVVHGATSTTDPDPLTVTAGRQDDRVNVAMILAASLEAPWAVAAQAASTIATSAEDNPPLDYYGGSMEPLIHGSVFDFPGYPARNALASGGVSACELSGAEAHIGDTLTFYRLGSDPPPFRYVNDIMKLANVIYAVNNAFLSWSGAPLVPDSQAVAEGSARKPSGAMALVSSVIDRLALSAILVDSERTTESISATINAENPKRLDVSFTAVLSGNNNITSTDLRFGFSFG